MLKFRLGLRQTQTDEKSLVTPTHKVTLLHQQAAGLAAFDAEATSVFEGPLSYVCQICIHTTLLSSILTFVQITVLLVQ